MLYSIDNEHNKRTQVIENLGQMGEDVTFKTDMLDMHYQIPNHGVPVSKRVEGRKLLINAKKYPYHMTVLELMLVTVSQHILLK